MRLCLSILLLLSVSFSFAQDKVIVHLKDGSAVTYNMDDVDNVEVLPDNTSSSSQSSSETSVPSGGYVATAVDLGLSVKWASHNLGGSTSSDTGSRLDVTSLDSPLSEWGSDWRMPTDEEWKELTNKCTWEWTTRDGIGGRLVTGPSGNSIFLPATGVSLDQKTHIVGAVGFYWSSDTSETEDKSSIATYFDSANVFQMDFPAVNKFSVRPVKQ